VKKNKLQKNCNKLELKIKETTGWNKSRIFIIVGLIVSIIRLGRVNLKKIATKINPDENIEVNYRRINRFFQHFRFEKRAMARLMSSFLPNERWILTMDRTNWKFGKVHINILMLAVAYKGMAIPIIWILLPKDKKRGNSNYRDRIRILKKFIDIFGVDKIKVLVADREFIGEIWFRWLKKRKVPFVIRIKEGHKIKVGRGEIKVKLLFGSLQENQHSFYRTRKTIYGYQYLSLIAIKLKDEYLILATNIKQEDALGYYKRRWEIETLFSAFKIRGFNLEETHLSENKKIDSLISILSLAFVWCHVIGEWLNDKKPIKTLKHGRKEKSLFLAGFEYLDEIFSHYDVRGKELYRAIQLFDIGRLKN
jgi:transposase